MMYSTVELATAQHTMFAASDDLVLSARFKAAQIGWRGKQRSLRTIGKQQLATSKDMQTQNGTTLTFV